MAWYLVVLLSQKNGATSSVLVSVDIQRACFTGVGELFGVDIISLIAALLLTCCSDLFWVATYMF